MRIPVLVLLPLLAIGLVSSSAAQQKRAASWLVSVGGQYGTTKPDCDDCESAEFKGGIGGFVRFGFRVVEGVYVGLEGSGHLRDVPASAGQEGNGSVGYGSVFLQWYPKAESGFYAKLGGGVGYVEALYETGPSTSQFVDKTGFGLTVGLGFDVPVSTHVAVGPLVQFGYANLGDITVPGATTVPGVTAFSLGFGVGVTFF